MQTTRVRRRPLPERSIWDKTWRDHNGNVVIWQTPNAILIAWAAVTFVALFVGSRLMYDILYWTSEGLLAIWALLEVWKGADYFRRAFGVVVLAVGIAAAFNLF